MKYLSFLILLLAFPLLVFAQDAAFVPLTTNAPFLEGLGNADRLPDFLNNIYKVCIGVAAVLAVLQIMRAGIMYMGGDSVTEKKEAKNLIAMSIGGLVLVLSPVVVFSLINPDILNLEIKGIEELKVAAPVYTGGVNSETANATAWSNSTIDRQAEKAKCTAEGRTMEFACRNNTSGVERKVPETEVCVSGETNVNRCLFKAGEQTQACPANLSRVQAFSRSCPTDNGYVQVGKSCCGLDASDPKTCCGSTDGRKPDDPSISSFYTRKTFDTEALANTFAQACSDIRTHNPLVRGREGNVKQLPRPEGSVNTPYLGQCFSFSVDFPEFMMFEKSTGKMVKFGDVTAGDIRYSNFKNGCRDEGGDVEYRDPAIARSPFRETCSAQGVSEAAIFAQYPGTGPTTHRLECRKEDHVCKK